MRASALGLVEPPPCATRLPLIPTFATAMRSVGVSTWPDRPNRFTAVHTAAKGCVGAIGKSE